MKRARVLLCALVVMSLLAARRRAVEPGPPPPAELKSERSFAITEKSILAGFTLDRVLGALTARSVVSTMPGEQLFRQLFDTQNPKPGLDAAMPHCDDFLLDGKPSNNGFLRRCPTDEAVLATAPFRPADFVPVALINRFDMADAAGASCGQYRIIFSGVIGPAHRVNIIFEGGLPNPRPTSGIGGCRPIAQFWADLSAVDSLAERRARLESFFYDGIAGFPPLIHPDHYRDAPNGIRNMHLAPAVAPRFYQFRAVNECRDGACRFFVRPDGLENFPSSRLLDTSDTTDRAVRFREAFLGEIGHLAERDVNAFFMNVPSEFLMAENDFGDRFPHFLMNAGFSTASRTQAGAAYHARIESELQKAGSAATVEDVLFRATVLNCEGCHTVGGPLKIGDGLAFPIAGPDAQHVTRDAIAPGEEGSDSRFAVSPAMRDVFIPNRMKILIDFLKSGKAPTRSQ